MWFRGKPAPENQSSWTPWKCCWEGGHPRASYGAGRPAPWSKQWWTSGGWRRSRHSLTNWDRAGRRPPRPAPGGPCGRTKPGLGEQLPRHRRRTPPARLGAGGHPRAARTPATAVPRLPAGGAGRLRRMPRPGRGSGVGLSPDHPPSGPAGRARGAAARTGGAGRLHPLSTRRDSGCEDPGGRGPGFADRGEPAGERGPAGPRGPRPPRTAARWRRRRNGPPGRRGGAVAPAQRHRSVAGTPAVRLGRRLPPGLGCRRRTRELRRRHRSRPRPAAVPARAAGAAGAPATQVRSRVGRRDREGRDPSARTGRTGNGGPGCRDHRPGTGPRGGRLEHHLFATVTEAPRGGGPALPGGRGRLPRTGTRRRPLRGALRDPAGAGREGTRTRSLHGHHEPGIPAGASFAHRLRRGAVARDARAEVGPRRDRRPADAGLRRDRRGDRRGRGGAGGGAARGGRVRATGRGGHPSRPHRGACRQSPGRREGCRGRQVGHAAAPAPGGGARP